MPGALSISPWLVVAGLGALHGLNPANGWVLAAAWSVRSANKLVALRALLPIAMGHAASVALVAAAVAGAAALGPSIDLVALQVLAVAGVATVSLYCLLGHPAHRPRVSAGSAGLALWSFLASSVQGAGLMLVPALAPLCIGDASVREITASGSLLLALAAVGVHMIAMLAVTGAMAVGASRGVDFFRAVFARRANTQARTRPAQS